MIELLLVIYFTISAGYFSYSLSKHSSIKTNTIIEFILLVPMLILLTSLLVLEQIYLYVFK